MATSFASATSTPLGGQPIFEPTNTGSNEQFRASFDARPFEFRHGLTTSHPLFNLPAIRRLLEVPEVKNSVAYDAADVRVDQRWETIPKEKPPIEEVFDHIATSGGWIMMRFVHRVPEYKAILDACLGEVRRLSGRDVQQDEKSREAIIFVTSPNRVTPYHIDRECNFLMQVMGEKTINIFDRNDKEVVTDQELETYWSKDNNAGVYKPQFQDRAFVTTMRPGTGVHIPVNFPHWVQNRDNVSISLSISYQYKDWKRKNVYQANYFLRKLGMNPTPPGESAVLDYTKRVVIEAAHRTKRMIKPKK
ncbi:MAG TPA: hypothetical protein VF018_04325 [Acidobacteriaceae bacterium]